MSQQSMQLFADRILNVAVSAGLVRLELGALQAPHKQGEPATIVPTQTLVMPLEGFAASMGMLDGLVKKLVEDGVLKLAPATEQVTSDTQTQPTT